MARSKRKAGRNIRNLALLRRMKAIYYFLYAAGFALSPFLFFHIFKDLWQPFEENNSLNINPIMYLPFVFGFTICAVRGYNFWKRAGHADQGARGEEKMAEVITTLADEGWEIEYGMRLGNRLGDADIVCISPQKKAYVIDVKSHRGEVTSNGEKLSRRMGAKSYPFEKNFLRKSMQQAFQVKKQKNLKFVTPILAFSEAQVSVPPGKVRGVYIVEKLRLVPLLKSLG